MKNVLIKPLYTEKITQFDENLNQYAFIVEFTANKIEIANSIEKKFNVKVQSVNTIRYKGKAKVQFTKKGVFRGRTPRFKKAYVTLKEGSKIELLDQV